MSEFEHPNTRKRSSSAFESLSPFSSRASSSSSSSSTAATSQQSPILVKEEPELVPDENHVVPRLGKRTRTQASRFSPSTVSPNKSLVGSSGTNKSASKGKRKGKVSSLPAGVYVVEEILARSFARGYREGKHEWQFLVRWEGYGPEDDTWEMRSTLKQGSEKLLRAFEINERPFTILDSRGVGQNVVYLVRYCLDTPQIPPSPQAPQAWHTVTRIMQWAKASEYTVRSRIADFEFKKHGYRSAVHVAPPDPSRNSKRQAKLATPEVKSEVVVKAEPEEDPTPVLIAFIDLIYRRCKSAPSRMSWGNPLYLARYSIKSVVHEQWMSYFKMNAMFGVEAARTGRESFRAERQKRTVMQQPVIDPSEYEDARQKNIEENQALMKQLGF